MAKKFRRHHYEITHGDANVSRKRFDNVKDAIQYGIQLKVMSWRLVTVWTR